MGFTLRFDRGTLLLEGGTDLPASMTGLFRFDPRVDAFRASCEQYREIVEKLGPDLEANRAPRYQRLKLSPLLSFEPYPHQTAALQAWTKAGRRGLVVLPTGAGKSLIGMQALASCGRSGMVIVPTIDLMHQWFALLKAAFPETEVGLLGGGYHDASPLLVSTYDSAARQMERLGNQYGVLIADEVHHLPSEFYRSIAEFSLAPYRLGLTATLERSDMRHRDLFTLIGPLVYHCEPEDLAGDVLAPYQIKRLYVELTSTEREAYTAAQRQRDAFLEANNISLKQLDGWSRFVMISSRTIEGRQAMHAHQELRRLSHAAPAKLRALELILAEHPQEKAVVFTEDNATVYELSKKFLIPCITHQTPIKERHHILTQFRNGTYRALATSKALNEGVDVPDASVGVILSGSAIRREFVQRLGRILRRAEGKKAVLYEVVTRQTREEGVAARRMKNHESVPPA